MYSKARRIGKQVTLNFPDNTQFKPILQFINHRQSTSRRMTEIENISTRNWLSQCIPTLSSNFKEILRMNSLKNVFSLLNALKLHRSSIYAEAEDNLNQQQISNLNIWEKLSLLRSMVNFKHTQNKVLKQNLRNSFLGNPENQWSVRNNFFAHVKFIECIILDDELSSSEQEALIRMITSTFRNASYKKVEEQYKFEIHLSKLYEMMKIKKINSHSEFLRALKESYSKMKYTASDFEKEKIVRKLVYNNQENKKFESIFELIFQDFLQKNGYDYESNVLFCNNQYDILVHGKLRSKHLPFKDFAFDAKFQDIPEFPLDKLKKLANSLDVEWIADGQKFDEKIVIDLHGPCHYIDSDNDRINDTITKYEQFRYLKLPMYGINRYNFVNYKQWEEKSKYPQITLQFVKATLQNSIKLKPI